MRELRDLAHVPRWVIARVIRRQSVAEHSYYVCAYSHLLCLALERKDLIERCVTYSIWHDVSEATLGDMPGPVKRALGGIDEFEKAVVEVRFGGDIPKDCIEPTLIVKLIVKLANLIDEVGYLLGEQRMGNQTVNRLLDHSMTRMQTALERLEDMVALLGADTPQYIKPRMDAVGKVIGRVMLGESEDFSRDCSSLEIQGAEDAHRRRRMGETDTHPT
jgi:5'-deoxynucleotidase YfbR-like HD superfamily hydrolase